MNLLERFQSKISPEPNSGCWLWDGGGDRRGYGTLHILAAKGCYRNLGAHRIAYELFRGAIPDGMTIDHLCKTPGCVNPDHLEIVTRGENTRRGSGSRVSGEINLAKTHCPVGHPYSGGNLYVNPKGRRECRICRKARVEAFHARRRAA